MIQYTNLLSNIVGRRIEPVNAVSGRRCHRRGRRHRVAEPEPKKIGGTGSPVIAAAVVMVERHRVLRRRGRVVATATAAAGFIGDFRHSARTFLLEEIQKAADFLLREGWHFFENRRLLRKIK